VLALTRPAPAPATSADGYLERERRRDVRDSLVVTIGGQLERALGTVSSLLLRWWLDPALLGVYTGLRLYLDQTNRTSLGVGLGAVQEIPILRAAGREAEARRVADVAHTTNTLTCLVYAAALLALAWLRAPALAGDPLAAEWTWGLVAVAGLTLLKRYESFLIAVLRAQREFVLTTELDLFESLVSAAALAAGLAAAGFWGLLAAVGAILGLKIVYLRTRHPFRFGWAWEPSTAWRLMKTGLPILANTAAFGALLNLDRALILWRVPDGARAAGLYTIAILGTGWSLDLAGRIVLVLYTSFQTALGRTGDPAEVVLLDARATEAQAAPLAAGAAWAFAIGPAVLGALMPRYVEGLPALRPLLPGMTLLGLAWPARQLLIAIGRPYRLCLATTAGLLLAAAAGLVGADRSGIVGVAWGMSAGYAAVFLLTGMIAFLPTLGWRGWLAHQGRLAGTLAWYAAGALLAANAAPVGWGPVKASAGRCAILAAWTLPALAAWGRRHRWGGLFDRGTRRG
jgi:O-antigen/teichoic acid export membrane protein